MHEAVSTEFSKNFWYQVQNEFGPIEGQGIKLKFFTPLQLQFDVKKISFVL